MVRYSIEILDGERKGELLPITGGRFTIGRKPGNALVLNDEKVSGVHAEIVAEAGSVVLRDLGSTNGTRIENRKIDEVPLAPGDVIQIGLTKIRLVPQEGLAPVGAGDDVAQMHRVDANAMARLGKKRVGVPLLLFLVLVLAGGGVAYWQLVLNEDSPTRPRRAVLDVARNLLPPAAANLEGDAGYEPVAGGVVFGPSSRANTGTSALEATLAKETPFAAVRLAAPVKVPSGQPLTVRAHVAGDPGVAAGARVVFLSSSDPARQLVAGGPLRKLDAKYELQEATVRSPAWADRAAVLVLAAGEGKAFVDDLALVPGGAGAAEPVVLNDRTFTEVGGVVYADAAAAALLRAVRPALPAGSAADQALAALAASGFLLFTDLSPAGAPAKLEAAGDRVRLQCEPVPSLAVVLVVPAANLATGRVAVQQENGKFAFYGDRFEVKDAKGVLVGGGVNLTQLLATVPAAGTVQCVPQGDDLAITLPCPSGTVEFQVDFGDGLTAIHDDMRQAGTAIGDKNLGKAIQHFDRALQLHPFVPDQVDKALRERTAIVDGFRKEIEALDQKVASADFFKTRGGYEEALAAAEDLARRFEGAEEQLPDVKTREESLRGKLSELVQHENQRVADALSAVGAVLAADNRKELAELVKSYVERRVKKGK